MGTHRVISEFIDLETGDRISPAAQGEEPLTFTPHDDDQAHRLVSAGCLIAESQSKSAAIRQPAAADPLDHDGDGSKGGSKSGPESTAAKGRARRQVAEG